MELKSATITIVGLGLMGGSLAAALKVRNACKRVWGLTRNENIAEKAVNLDIVDSAGTNARELIPKSDIVILATPVKTIESQIPTFGSFMKPGSILTDLGSVKSKIVSALEQLPSGVYGVGGHPMCGKEISGLDASDRNLFVDRIWVVCPGERTSDHAVDILKQIINAVEAKPLVIDPETHDEAVACISHFTYLLSASLVATAEQYAITNPYIRQVAAGGFRDTTRIAAGNVGMMLDIIMSNRTNILKMFDSEIQRLTNWRNTIVNQDYAALKSQLENVKQSRSHLYPFC